MESDSLNNEIDYFEKVSELVTLIRSKQPATSLFLAMFETFPNNVWQESVKRGILTPFEFQGCILVLKQYRRLQATSAIQKAESKG